MDNSSMQNHQPYDFGRAIFLPFHSGPGSTAFVLKSALFYALALTAFFALFGLTIAGFVLFFIAAIWMQLIVGISTYVTDLYKRNFETADVGVFD